MDERSNHRAERSIKTKVKLQIFVDKYLWLIILMRIHLVGWIAKYFSTSRLQKEASKDRSISH